MGDGRAPVTRTAPVLCPTSWNNPGLSNSASLSIGDDDPELWDTLFRPQPDGARWYALQVAAVNAHGAWDSRFGQNYRLVLQPR